jgi:stage IV sporulation protein FB
VQFKFLQIPVRIVPSFWVFLVFFTGLYRSFAVENFILGGVLLLSLLVHEYGHALTAAFFGAKPKISLEAFGGNAQYNGQMLSLKERFLVTLNGPLLESLLIAIPYFLLKSGLFSGNHYMEYTLYVTMRVNLFWCILNLIPVYPLDGGQMLAYLLEMKFAEKGRRAAYQIGTLIATAAATYLFSIQETFFAVLLVIFAVQNYQMVRLTRKSFNRANPYSTYVQGIKAIEEGNTTRGKALLKRLLKSKDEKVKNSAAEALAKIYLEEKKEEKSYALLNKTDKDLLKEGKILLCELAFRKGDYSVVTKYARELYDIKPSYEVAILNSKAFAHLSEPYYAGAWLQTAAQFSPDDKILAKELLQDSLYDLVREEPSFKEKIAFFQMEEVEV